MIDADLDDIARLEFALQDFLRKRILDLLLNCAFQRPRPIHRIEAGIGEFVPCRLREMNANIAIGKLASRQTVTRRVTNVSDQSETYVVEIAAPDGIAVEVEPRSADARSADARSVDATGD